MKYNAVVVAGGVGKRANLGFNKVFFVMENGKTVLENACSVFINDHDCTKIIVVCNEEDKVFKNEKVLVVKGGKQRSDSVYNGLVNCKEEFVMIHDAARPYLTIEDVEKIKEALLTNDGVLLAKKAVDTIKYVENGYVTKTINRENIYLALTPQSFKTKEILAAYNCLDTNDCTDDSAVFEKYGKSVYVVEGNPKNIKLTLESDFKK